MKKHNIISASILMPALVLTANASCIVNPNQANPADDTTKFPFADSVVYETSLIAVGDNLYAAPRRTAAVSNPP